MAYIKLEGNADAVEFCPSPPFFHVLASATYTLHEASAAADEHVAQQAPFRLGSLSLFTIAPCGDLQLRQTHFLNTCGIFDIKWSPPDSSASTPFLAQAGADGSLALYNLQMIDSPYLSELRKDSISSSMCLSLDWNPHSKQQITISHSDGNLSVVDVTETTTVSQHTEHAHSFESWCVAYDTWRPNILYSGGDDCHFNCWDIRQGLFQPVFREKKTHQMGVCSIQSNPHKESTLVTGSYDEKLRIWDMRMLHQPILEKFLGLGGGVWKLKWCPVDKRFLAAACMHNGFMIVKVEGEDILVAMEYKKHDSLAYGVDWFKGPSKCSATTTKDNPESLLPLVASCSFYDRSLHVWKPECRL